LKLKQTTALFFSLFLVLLLAMPSGQIISADDAGVMQPRAPHQPQNLATPIVVIKVVSVFQPANMTVSNSQTATAGASCLSGAQISQNLIQNTGKLNLNQPANCFSFVQTKPAPLPSLSVKPLTVPASHIVVVPSPVYTPNYTIPATPQNLPVLPAAAAALIVYAVFAFSRLERKTKTAVPSFFSYNLSIAQLQVFRC